MSVFNSLGSNYSAEFVRKSLFGTTNKTALGRLTKLVEERYGGQATLTYKGRHALELALKQSGLPAGSTVGINGFTCYVVYQAVERAGYKPVMIDTALGQLNFDQDGLSAIHARHQNLKAVIVQNTLGIPAPIGALEAYCNQHNILIIEDLAHSFGMRYDDGREAGTVGQLVMLSFSQDKPLDVVAGGALINKLNKNNQPIDLPTISPWQRIINRTYPFWTAIIRGTYAIGLGRFIHAGLKTLHLLATPMSDNVQKLHGMSPKATALLVDRWKEQTAEFEHRQQIAHVYRESLAAVQFDLDASANAVFLRFPIQVNNRASLVNYLKKQHIYIGDTWYDAPIGPKRYMQQTNYQSGQCPNAEEAAQTIVNLPTHRNVTEDQARIIAQKVNLWLKSQ